MRGGFTSAAPGHPNKKCLQLSVASAREHSNKYSKEHYPQKEADGTAPNLSSCATQHPADNSADEEQKNWKQATNHC
jgi:hypothetical protein